MSISLGTWPTPVDLMPRCARTLGLGADDLWIKRDDVTGLGGGGNKIRKLQYTCAQAVALGATTLITSGAPQSNHARLTAAAAARLGLRCILVLRGTRPETMQGNLVLDAVVGADIVWAGQTDTDSVIAEAGDSVVRSGGIPFVIPFGGTSAVAAQGYVDCAREIEQQIPGFDRVVVAVGSGGTMAGLVAHLGADRVIGVDVGAVSDPVSTVAGLLDEMPGPAVRSGNLRIVRDQVGQGYSTLTDGSSRAIRHLARTEGIFLDPTYTGRAFAGLMNLVEDNVIAAGTTTVFLHTGGLPGLFGHAELSTLL
ncbi:D-cysteine desulfhydrase family protein [Rhodococcus sp. IEGM 1379]|uniref:D-cysteine desulfhydrase family protein n=1 Tax=Rhodococcus sp. IEGM 1379 TaxID=3047086 RepID=UPI0024B813FA|nr:D-cysteine desulfhydrase family protein [Rhodococcus sp. IEGM 1379]MDI9913958.1 D-cysteine desulfhydrase family protein [Rhodococcus sp. IEGM 1379]